MTILLIGANNDPHILAVEKEINEIGHQSIIFDSIRSVDTLAISYGQDAAPKMVIKSSDGKSVESDEIYGIWLRQKPMVPNPGWSPFNRAAAEFSQIEWRTVLNSLQICCNKALWVNDPYIQANANSKPKQLAVASSLGFNIPKTIITNDPARVNEFIIECKRVIYKSLNWYTFPDQTGILTTEITANYIKDKDDAIKNAPGIYQQLIEKDFELRITVIGEKSFPALIRTPKTGLGAIDWRHAHFEDIFEAYAENVIFHEHILKFHRKFGLEYGTYDFIVDKSGKKYFLECNPAGQYLWLENSLGLKISKEIAKKLTSRNNNF